MTRALEEATANDLALWRAFAELEPFGPLADSRRAGVAAAASLAPWSKRGEAPRPEDLFPELQEWDREPMSDEAMKLRCQAWAAAFAGRE